MNLSWITIVWSGAAAACVTIALVNLSIWLKQPGRAVHLVFAVIAASVAANAACELLLMNAQTPQQFGVILRWRHVPLFILVVSLVAYIRLYLRAGSLWLAGAVCALRLLVLLINFSVEPNINFERIASLSQLSVPGGETVAVAVGPVRPWKWLTQLSILLVLLFALQASVALWRRGGPDERRRVLVVVGSFALFVTMAAVNGALAHTGVIHVPYMTSLYFLVIVAVAGNELSSDAVRAARLAQQLQESETRFRAMANTAPVMLWMTDTDNLGIFFNNGWLSFTGRTLEQESGNGWAECVHREDFDRCLEVCVKSFRARQSFTMEFRLRRWDGEYRWVLDTGVPRFARDGTFLGFTGSCIDVTERKQGHDLLKHERAFLRQVIDITPNLIFAKDRESRFTLVNQAVADLYGSTVENLVGKTHADFSSNVAEIEHFRRVDMEVMNNLQEQFIPEERITDADGKVRWLQTVKQPIFDEDGRANQLLGSATDITRHKQAELELTRQRNELAHLSRVTMLGELSGSLAHELNQPLTAILSNAQAAQRLLARDDVDLDEVREILKDIVSDDKRAGEVIHGLRMLLKQGETRHQPLDLNGVVRDVIRLVRSDLVNHAVILNAELAPVLPMVGGDRVQLQQVLLNLVVNGYEAMAGVSGTERRLTVRTSLNDEQSVCVSVTDMGHGVPPEHLERVFEPFFTTKTQGLGLGLAVCRTIISAQGGHLWAANNTTRGATFQFKLPAQPAAAT